MSPKSQRFTIVSVLSVLTRLGLVVAVVVLILTPAASAVVFNTVEYGATVIVPEPVAKVDGITADHPVTVGSGLLQSSVGGSTASVIAFASSAPGHIGVSVVGTAQVNGPGPGAVVSAHAKASFEEKLRFQSISIPDASIGANVHMLLFGDLSATSGPFGAAHVTVTVNGEQFTVQTANVSGGPIDQRPPVSFPMTIRSGDGNLAQVLGSVSISGLAQTGSGNSEFFGNYGNSLHWGGIDSVVDIRTGEIIDDWTVTSESGADYAHPIGFPDGDTDFDEDVDLEDLNAVRNHFGETGRFVVGDTSPYDGVVDLADLNAVRNHFGTAPNPVPEPSTLALLSVVIVGAVLIDHCVHRQGRDRRNMATAPH